MVNTCTSHATVSHGGARLGLRGVCALPPGPCGGGREFQDPKMRVLYRAVWTLVVNFIFDG